jgi:hypothetical protein
MVVIVEKGLTSVMALEHEPLAAEALRVSPSMAAEVDRRQRLEC